MTNNITNEDLANVMRDITHNLNLNIAASDAVYKQALKQYFVKLEGSSDKAYDDRRSGKDKWMSNIIRNGKEPKGKVTIGIGFNMNIESKDDPKNKDNSRVIWAAALPEVSFDDAKEGKIELTEEQIDRLFDKTIEVRLRKLRGIYGNSWNKFRPNERLSIISAFFNCEALVNGSSQFSKHMKLYAETHDPEYLKAAVKELRENSNGGDIDLQSRRDAEATLLNSLNCPFYVAGTERHLPEELPIVYAEKTRIPRGLVTTEPNQNEDYFIWRTKMDDKVRASHIIKEGMIFRKDRNERPKGEANCRCYEEAIPDIIEDIAQHKSYFLGGIDWRMKRAS